MTKPLRRPEELVRSGLAGPERLEELRRVAAEFQVAITPAMAALIDGADPADPIARQFVPDARELAHRPDERADPIGDEAHSPVPGIVHRYPDRVLLMPTRVCAVYCRFCFRREQVGKAGALSSAELERALDYVRERPAIWEVILTGGDPLVLSPRRLKGLVEALDAIAHLGVIRIHTRVPAVDPGRVTPALVRALSAQKAVWVVLHADHPRELTDEARSACARLVDAGIPMLAQSVLLKGVNDDAETLTALLRRLVAWRIKPYYLHHADLARGTGHFRTTLDEGRAVVRQLRGRVSGLCQPAYVLDIPGGFGKVPVGPCHARKEGHGWVVEDIAGRVHPYDPDA